MSPLTQEDIKAHLLEATARKAKIFTYTDLLGFRKLSKSKSRNCHPAYDGQVKSFYEAIKTIALELSQNYESLDELQERIRNQENFTENLVDDTIEEYGSEIWNDGESGFVTVLDDEDDDEQSYPRYLIYNNDSDRISIRTFIYCLTLVRTCRNITNQGVQIGDDPIIQTELPYTAPRGARVEISNVTVPDPDTVSAESARIVPTTAAFSNSGGSRSLQTTCEYQIPVAHMVPSDTRGNSSSSNIPQLNTVGVSLGTSTNLNAMEGYCQPSEMSRSQGRQTTFSSSDQFSRTNSGRREEIRQSYPQKKRRRSVQGEGAGTSLQDFTGRSARRRKGPTCNISRSTSPNVSCEVTDNSEDQRLMDMPHNRTTRNNANGVSCVQCQSRINTRTNDDPDDDAITITDGVDSVMGSPRLSPTVEEEDEDNEPILIVKLKIQSQKAIRQRELYRIELAVKLAAFFEKSSGQTEVLGEIVTLIKDIKNLDTPRPQSGSDIRRAPYQLILDQWLDLVDIYLRFRQSTDSNNDPTAWVTHCESLEPTERFRKYRVFNTARLEVRKWSFKHENHDTYEWSKCATSTLLEMADWGLDLTTVDMEDMRKTFVKFNESLVRGQFWSLPL